MSRFLKAAILSGAVTLMGLGAASAQAPLSTKPPPKCFYANDWSNWKAADAHTLYLQVRYNQVYRLDFANACEAITWPNAHIVTVFHGTNSICSALDLSDFRVADDRGVAQSCIVTKLTPLSPADVATLPKSVRP